MRILKTAMAAIMFASVLATGGVASADQGDYWLDACHDTQADELIWQGLRLVVTCSADPYAQGYGGDGVEAWALIQVSIYNDRGEKVHEINDGLRPTGARFTPGLTDPTSWVGGDFEYTVVDPSNGENLCVTYACAPDTPPIIVPVPTDLYVDSDEQYVRTKRDGWQSWHQIEVCHRPNGSNCGDPVSGDPIIPPGL